MRVDGFRVEFVGFESQTRSRGRARRLAGQRPAKTHDRPAARRHRPLQPPVGREPVGQVDHFRRIDTLVRWHLCGGSGRGKKRLHAGGRGIGSADVECFFVHVRDARAARRGRESQHTRILIIGLPRLKERRGERLPPKERRPGRWTGENGVEGGGPIRLRLAGHEVLHRQGRRDPWPPGAAPAGACAERHLQAQAVGLREGVADELLPRRAHELHRPTRDAEADFEIDRAADAGGFHGLQVGCHPFPGKVAIHEIPIDPGACSCGR